jgi:hypothetical protein
MLFSDGSVKRITLLKNPEGRFEKLGKESNNNPEGEDDPQKRRERPKL